MIREDLLATGILIIALLFIILGIMVTVWVFNTTEDICKEFPQLSRAIRLTSITLLLIMWLLIALLALYALTLALRPGRPGSITSRELPISGFITISTI